jgi:hypothetical protein
MLRETKRLKALGRLLVFLTGSLAWPPACAPGQELAKAGKGDLLPPMTGESLTITPTDKPDVTCSVVEWDGASSKPALTVLCPPPEVFAPLHVYLKLSWLKPEEVPAHAGTIHAPAKTLTKLRTNKSAVWVWLAVEEKHDAPVRGKWVAFTGLVDVALLSDLTSTPHPSPVK